MDVALGTVVTAVVCHLLRTPLPDWHVQGAQLPGLSRRVLPGEGPGVRGNSRAIRLRLPPSTNSVLVDGATRLGISPYCLIQALLAVGTGQQLPRGVRVDLVALEQYLADVPPAASVVAACAARTRPIAVTEDLFATVAEHARARGQDPSDFIATAVRAWLEGERGLAHPA